MAFDQKLKEAVEKLFTQSMLQENEVDELFQKAMDVKYWRALSPWMGIMDQKAVRSLESSGPSSEMEASALSHLARHGYFQLPTVTSSDAIGRMCSSVESLRNAGWPAVFSYVYDEFWALLRTPGMVRFLSRHLGPGYVQNANVWTYRVNPRTRSSGWPPHTDNWDYQDRLTLWIPLTDATIDNGCMYVIPQDCVPSMLPRNYSDWESVSKQDLQVLLHNVTPLPAAAGSVLGWHHQLIHWGGRATKSTARARISFAVEFLREAGTPSKLELPVFDKALPDIHSRLRVISRAILKYEKFEPAMRRYHDLALKLTNAVS
jgi:hypothetical protein